MCYQSKKTLPSPKKPLEISSMSSSPLTPSDTSVNTMSSNICPCCRSISPKMCSDIVQSKDYDECRCDSSSKSNSAHFTYPKSYSVYYHGRRTLLLVFIIILTLPTAMSNPLHSHDSESSGSSGHRRHSDFREERSANRPSKWINPCRIPSTVPTFSNEEIPAQSDAEIFGHIIAQVTKAERQSREFMSAFFEESFGSKLEHDKYKDIHYDFLTSVSDQVGKYLGEEIGASKLSELKVEDTLRSMYEGFQKFAVGLEQIVLDQAVYGGNFHQNFNEAEFQLKYVLCELQIAMLEKNIQHKDITRAIMSETYRDLDDKTMRNLRDWLIFRDYVNALEYLKQAFSHFLKQSGGRDSS